VSRLDALAFYLSASAYFFLLAVPVAALIFGTYLFFSLNGAFRKRMDIWIYEFGGFLGHERVFFCLFLSPGSARGSTHLWNVSLLLFKRCVPKRNGYMDIYEFGGFLGHERVIFCFFEFFAHETVCSEKEWMDFGVF
jgi:hypothetical protein